jgi:3-oxoacyl-[acyl-carrier protein] reductase
MLSGKVAIVTGASRGIGRAIALRFARAGADVAVVYAGSDGKADEVCKEASGFGVRAGMFKCDVGDFGAVKETVDAVAGLFGTVDILVNNAGVTRDGLIIAMKESAYDAVMDTNLKGAFNMIRHCAPIFVKRRGGKIVNISSVAGITGNPGQSNYSASKAGIIGLTRTVARELASRSVCCNAIAPGLIETDMSEKIREDGRILSAIPMGRAGLPEEVAELALFLSGRVSDYITGEVIRIDGGLAA